MKKIFSIFLILSLFVIISISAVLSTKGIETNKFNSLISKRISDTNKNILLDFSTINFKFDIKEISLFLETKDPILTYREIGIPIKNIKVYIDFFSILKSKAKIKKINLIFNKIDIKELQKISLTLKPSNLKSFINNKILEGKLNTELELYFDENNSLENFITRGQVSNLKTKLIKDINLEKVKFTFFADNQDVLIKNFYGKTGPIKIEEGDIKIKLNPTIFVNSNFKTNIAYSSKHIKHLNLVKRFKFSKNIKKIQADLFNNFSINFDKTYKVIDYNYNVKGNASETILEFKNSLSQSFLIDTIDKLNLNNTKIESILSPKKNIINISGKYSSDNKNNLKYELENIFNEQFSKINLAFDYDRNLKLDIINYQKKQNSIANILVKLEKKKNNILIEEINFLEGKNSFNAKGIKLKKNKFHSLDKISVKTFKDDNLNNDFSLIYGDKILIKGNRFDASNLPKILNDKNNDNRFSKVNKDIEIDFSKIFAPMSEKLENFKLIGKIENGKFIKISSKGGFGSNNFLDITMKNDKKNKKKYLEIYSDSTKPLLTEYNFFKGLTGGKLLYTSVIDKEESNSKLKIENFKLINAPGMIKLLSLADLSGLADLAQGDGISFDILEIEMEKKGDYLKLNEIVAHGPSMSVIIEGYQDSSITSLRGTLVPAKTLNNIISKIPVLGKIVIPKEVGEGLFGISFKMKGPPGKIKTSINPIRTITPRFIQKIIDNKKKSK